MVKFMASWYIIPLKSYHSKLTYILINARCIKVKHTGVKIKLSIQRELNVLRLAETMLFT